MTERTYTPPTHYLRIPPEMWRSTMEASESPRTVSWHLRTVSEGICETCCGPVQSQIRRSGEPKRFCSGRCRSRYWRTRRRKAAA